MPIRFACEHCDSTLSVSSRKAGHQVMCPKCRQQTPVPLPAREPAAVAATEKSSPSIAPPPPRSDAAAPDSEPQPSVAIGPPSSESNATPPSAFVSPTLTFNDAPAPTSEYAPDLPEDDDGPDEVTWVYEGSLGRSTSAHVEGEIDFDRISLPRYVLYGQGVLLIAVAMVSLTLGILIGRGTAPRVVEKSGVAKPCFLTGNVTYQTSGGNASPDAGAVVIVVPQDRRPDDKAPVEGLRPDDPAPAPDQPAIARIKSIGGDYVRADEQGNFKLRVPDTGDYFLLVISRHARRKPGERHESVHLAQIGRYFIPAPDLVDTQQYRWRSESIKRDKDYKFAFE